MQKTHRDISKKEGRLIECLKLCIDSLGWIKDNSPTHGINGWRARATLKEIRKILDK